MIWAIVAGIAGFFLGSVPTAYIVGRLHGVDIRKHGSGNVGMTNAWRVLGWKAGVFVGIVDIAKGYLASAWLSKLAVLGGLGPVYAGILCGTAAILGHVFTPWLGFRGGKGVATAAGVLLGLMPLPVGICVAAFAVAFLSARTVSVGSLSAAAALPVSVFLLDRFTGFTFAPPLLWLSVALALFIFWTHRANIKRLLRGEELSFKRRRGA
ncbi:glycerol-3-phosphate 1-O-acyltransferase PlsY [Candidatus Bipolaricaulota bacterium]|nr:glycerol-3-phosphate 1-O-acyltransferase PlsY [Candidatus Bipolaricaulota bacterium]